MTNEYKNGWNKSLIEHFPVYVDAIPGVKRTYPISFLVFGSPDFITNAVEGDKCTCRDTGNSYIWLEGKWVQNT